MGCDALLSALVVFALASSVTVTGGLVPTTPARHPKCISALLVLARLSSAGRSHARAEMLLYFGVMIASTLLAYLIYEPRVAGIKLLIPLYAALVGRPGPRAGATVVSAPAGWRAWRSSCWSLSRT